jgi:hypothetical protein
MVVAILCALPPLVEMTLHANRSENRFKAVTPECFHRGSSPNSAWIPAKNMRE